MAGADIRPALDPIFEAFGVAATVTPPLEDPIETTVIWVTAIPEDWPAPGDRSHDDFSRREPKRLLDIRRDQVPSVPLKTRIVAPETLGGPTRIWRVDGFERMDAEMVRVFVIPDPDDE